MQVKEKNIIPQGKPLFDREREEREDVFTLERGVATLGKKESRA